MKSFIVFLILFSTSLASADQPLKHPDVIKKQYGTETGNGGDCVNIDHECIPRDLVEKRGKKKFIPVSSKEARDFWMSTPGFVDLMNDLASVHPGLALAIWDALSNANLYLVDWELDILPASETGMSAEYQADRQVCVRGESDIICSIPAYAASSYKLVWPLHEAFHSMFRSNLSPIRHEKVRALTSYLIENQKNLQYSELSEILSGMGLYHVLAYSYQQIIRGDPAALEGEVLRILTPKTNSSFQNRCYLFGLVSHGLFQDEKYFGPFKYYDFKYRFVSFLSNFDFLFESAVMNWNGYNLCPKEQYVDVLRRSYPDLILALEPDFHITDTSRVSEYSSESEYMYPVLYTTICMKIADKDYLPQLQKYVQIYRRARVQLENLKSESENEQKDLAKKTASQIVASLIDRSEILNKYPGFLQNGIDDLPKALSNCEKIKKLIDRNWFEKLLGIGE